MSATPNGAAAQPFASHSIRLSLNGQDRQLDVLPWTTLLDLLREQLDLVGSKKGCDHGQCVDKVLRGGLMDELLYWNQPWASTFRSNT